MGTPLSGVSRKILQYLEAIDRGNGKATRMDFFRIAGNEVILNNWIDYLSDCNLIATLQINKVYYAKTDAGQKLHELLKIHPYVGPLFNDLSRRRRHKTDNFGWNRLQPGDPNM
ncbi:MAG: hypothetical protein ACYC7D_15355 [Nitrososphaerales archaeon]